MKGPSVAGRTVLFDGVCNFCNATVNFIIARDPAMHFSFAALQSKSGQSLLREFGLETSDFDTIVLIDQGRPFIKSTAILRILRDLKWPWPALSALAILPASFRDLFYDLVSRNRYHWFGKRESCRIPTPAFQERFLE